MRKKGFLDGLFPPRYDFHEMLCQQAKMTAEGMTLLMMSLSDGDHSELEEIKRIDDEADLLRLDMETKLSETFSTPFDRQDIYSISRQMDQIMNFAVSTLVEIREFDVSPDGDMRILAQELKEGVDLLYEGIVKLDEDPEGASDLVRRMREREKSIQRHYIDSIRPLFELEDHVLALKKREIYHHLKDAGRSMGVAVDILHRIVFGMS